MLKYVCSGYGRYLPDFVLYSTHEPCCHVRRGLRCGPKLARVVYGVSQEDIDAYGRKHGNEVYKWRGMPDLLPVCFQEGQSPYPGDRQFSPPMNAKKLFSYRVT